VRYQHDGEVIFDGEAAKQADELASLRPRVLLPRIDIRQGVEDDEARLNALDEGDEPSKDRRRGDEGCCPRARP
jgi:hypothetical protein